MYERLLSLDYIWLNLPPFLTSILYWILPLLMLGTGFSIKTSESLSSYKQNKAIVVGLLGHWLLVPAAVYGICLLFKGYISPMAAFGLILIASCPTGSLSVLYARSLRCNQITTQALFSFSTLGSIILLPFNLFLWTSLYNKTLFNFTDISLNSMHFDMYQIAQVTFIFIGLPVAIGLLLARWKTDLAERMEKGTHICYILFFSILSCVTLIRNLDYFIKYADVILLVALGVGILVFAIGRILGWVFRLPLEEKNSVMLFIGLQNPGIALTLLFNESLFPPDAPNGGMVFITTGYCLFNLLCVIIMSFLAHFRKRRKPHRRYV